MLSFAVRRLHCSSGIVITASHNPSKYNGYKCYDPTGYQITDEAAAKIYSYMKSVDMFDGVKRMSFEDALANEEKVQLVGFGTFETKVRKARIGRNPATKESIEIPASKHPSFTAGKALKEIVNK
jgi:phosphoglucomutase